MNSPFPEGKGAAGMGYQPSSVRRQPFAHASIMRHASTEMPTIDLTQFIQMTLERQRYLEANGIVFLGEITDQAAERFGQGLVSMAVEREGRPDKPITVYINSGGGAVGAGLAMMQM